MSIRIKPIGVIRTSFVSSDKTPIQSIKPKAVGDIELSAEYEEGLESLNGFSHAILIYWFHQAKPCSMKVKPFLDTKERGLFATRAPSRPNPIGLSIVRIIQIDGKRIRFEGVDMLDQTPLIDIKPFVPEFDNRYDATSGWLADSIFSDVDEYTGDDRFLR